MTDTFGAGAQGFLDVKRRPGRLVLHLELPTRLPTRRRRPRPWAERALGLDRHRRELERSQALTQASWWRVWR